MGGGFNPPKPPSAHAPGPNNSTETVVLRVLTDLLEAVDGGGVAALVLLKFICCLRHCRSQHFVSTSGTDLWTVRSSFIMVPIVPAWSFPVHPPWNSWVIFRPACPWPNPIHHVYCHAVPRRTSHSSQRCWWKSPCLVRQTVSKNRRRGVTRERPKTARRRHSSVWYSPARDR